MKTLIAKKLLCNIRTVKKVEKEQSFVLSYLKEHKTNCLDIAAQKFIKNSLGYRITNEDRAKVEHYQFIKNPPEKYFSYVNLDKRIITTWTGLKLGSIVWIGSPFYSNFGDKRRHINIIGINGVKYSAVYFESSGDYCRMRQLKNQVN